MRDLKADLEDLEFLKTGIGFDDDDFILEYGEQWLRQAILTSDRVRELEDVLCNASDVINKIASMTNRINDLESLLQETVDILKEPVQILADWHGPNGRWTPEDTRRIKVWADIIVKAKGMLDGGKLS